MVPQLPTGDIPVLAGKCFVRISKRVLTNRMLTGYPLGMQMPGRPGLGGYWGVSTLLSFSVDCPLLFRLLILRDGL